MISSENKYDTTHPCEGSPELNRKDANYRTAPMISPAKVVRKMRVRGALVPIREDYETPGS